MSLVDANKGRSAHLGLVVCMRSNRRRVWYRFLLCIFSRRCGDRVPARGQAGGNYLRGFDPQRNRGGRFFSFLRRSDRQVYKDMEWKGGGYE